MKHRLTALWRATAGRTPRPLATLLVAVAVFGVCWALIVPPFQGPDEIQHYSYVETLVERHTLPGRGASAEIDPGVDQATPTSQTFTYLGAKRKRLANPASSAVLDAISSLNASGVTVGLAKPEQTDVAHEQWLRRAASQDKTDGGGAFPGSTYPPLYYGFEALGYALARNGTVIDHLYAARLWSVLCLLLTTIGVWMLVGQIAGRRRELQLVAAACVGFWPMVGFMSATVNPDALLYATWTWTLWAMAVIITEGLTARRLVVLATLFGAAVLTKETSAALVVPLAFVVGLGFLRLRREGRKAWLRPLIVLVAVLGIPAAALVAMSVAGDRPLLSQVTQSMSALGNPKEFASYVWEYYLPQLPGQTLHDYYIPNVSSYPAYNIWIAGAWGAFGWVTLYFPKSLYPWFLAVTLAIGAAAVTSLLRLWLRADTRTWMRTFGVPMLATFALAAFALLLGLHLTEYKLRSPTNQGRYLFPLAGLAGATVATALLWLPGRLRAHAVAAVLAALVIFEVGALGFVAAHYYA